MKIRPAICTTWVLGAAAANLVLVLGAASASPSGLPVSVVAEASVSEVSSIPNTPSIPSILTPPSDTTEKVETKVAMKDGLKTVTTVYAEGALAGKEKKKEAFRDGKLECTVEVFYDASGIKTHEVSVYPVDRKRIATFYAEGALAGNPQKSEGFQHGKLADTTEYFYDGKGRITHYETVYSDTRKRTVMYQYGEGTFAKKPKKGREFWDGKWESTTEYFDDVDGNLTREVKECRYDGKTVTTYYTEGKVARKPKKVEEFYEGELTSTDEYFYDAEGNKTRNVKDEVSTNTKKVITYFTEGAAVGKEKKDEEFEEGKLSETTEHFYDAKGNKTLEITERSDGRKFTTKYFYKTENLISRRDKSLVEPPFSSHFSASLRDAQQRSVIFCSFFASLRDAEVCGAWPSTKLLSLWDTQHVLTHSVTECTDGSKTVTAYFTEGVRSGDVRKAEHFKDGKPSGGHEFVCDTEGNIAQYFYEDAEGRKSIETYNTEGAAKGEWKKSERIHDGQLYTTVENFYDAEGNITHRVDENGEGRKMVCTFYTEGRLIGLAKEREAFHDGKLEYSSVCFYDEQRDLAHSLNEFTDGSKWMETYWLKGVYSGKAETEIEEKDGRKTVIAVHAEGALAGKRKKVEEFKDGELSFSSEYFYDDEGNKTHEVEDGGARILTIHTKGAAKGQTKRIETFCDRVLVHRWEYFFNDEGVKTQSVKEDFTDGSKWVYTYLTEGKAQGKRKTTEEFQNGLREVIFQRFYDDDGKDVFFSARARKSLSDPSATEFSYESFAGYRTGMLEQRVEYKGAPLDESEGVVLPDPLPPLPVKSGYCSINVRIHITSSDDTVVVKLDNMTDSPIEVHEDVFMSPSFGLNVGLENAYIRKFPSAFSSGAKAQREEAHKVVSLAPKESLRFETTLAKIFETRGVGFSEAVVSEEFQNSEVKLYIFPEYKNLFPLPPEAQSAWSTGTPPIHLGTLGEFKAKHPELFKGE